MFDATLVDDEAIVLASTSATKLSKAIDFALKALDRILYALRFQINWKPNKTECFVQFRGKHATKRLDERRNVNGDIVFRADGSSTEVRAVRSYKHLGGIVDADGSLGSEARNRHQMAMAAYYTHHFRNGFSILRSCKLSSRSNCSQAWFCATVQRAYASCQLK